MEGRHAQSPDLTSLYPANIGHSEVMGQRAWFGGGEREKPILRFLPGLFWVKCPTEMTHHPNGQS